MNGNVLMTLYKLFGIRGDFVRIDDSWESWDFVKFSEVLRLWIRRNLIDFNLFEKSDFVFYR